MPISTYLGYFPLHKLMYISIIISGFSIIVRKKENLLFPPNHIKIVLFCAVFKQLSFCTPFMNVDYLKETK